MKNLLPSNSKFLVELERLGQLFNHGDYKAMESCARLLLKKLPSNPYVWKALSVALIQQEKNKEAELVLYKSTELSPDDVDNLNNLGILLQSRKAWSEAEIVLRQAQQLVPASKDILFNLATTLMHQYKSQEALPNVSLLIH